MDLKGAYCLLLFGCRGAFISCVLTWKMLCAVMLTNLGLFRCVLVSWITGFKSFEAWGVTMGRATPAS